MITTRPVLFMFKIFAIIARFSTPFIVYYILFDKEIPLTLHEMN